MKLILKIVIENVLFFCDFSLSAKFLMTCDSLPIISMFTKCSTVGVQMLRR